MMEYISSLIFKCEFVGADTPVPNELRIYYTLFDVHWVKAFCNGGIHVNKWILYIC